MEESSRRPNRARSVIHWLLALVAIAASTVLVYPATPASAHVRLLRTSPEGGTVVTQPVKEITLVFNENGLKPNFTTVVVLDSAGRNYANGPVRVEGQSVIQPIKPLPATNFKVAWRTVSADGHPVESRFTFNLAPEAANLEDGETPIAATTPPAAVVDDAQPTPSIPARSASATTSRWIWIVGVGVGLLGIAAVVLLGRRTPGRKKAD